MTSRFSEIGGGWPSTKWVRAVPREPTLDTCCEARPLAVHVEDQPHPNTLTSRGSSTGREKYGGRYVIVWDRASGSRRDRRTPAAAVAGRRSCNSRLSSTAPTQLRAALGSCGAWPVTGPAPGPVAGLLHKRDEYSYFSGDGWGRLDAIPQSVGQRRTTMRSRSRPDPRTMWRSDLPPGAQLLSVGPGSVAP